jgi:hypothetical protein
VRAVLVLSPCGGHELDIALLFRLSPKAALNPVIVENHTRHEGGYAKNPRMEEAYDDCKPTKRILSKYGRGPHL